MTTRRGPSASVEVALAWARASEVPEDDAWLTPAEGRVLEALRVPKRASDWRLGRWVAKEAVRQALGAPGLAGREVEILAAESGRPMVSAGASIGLWAPTISLSHSGGMGFAAAATVPLLLGCDVEVLAPRSDAFVADYLTSGEAAWVREDMGRRVVRANLAWSAKEAALKALGQGLRMDTRAVEVEAREDGPGPWRELRVRGPNGMVLAGWWHDGDGYVWTVVADRPIRPLRAPPD